MRYTKSRISNTGYLHQLRYVFVGTSLFASAIYLVATARSNSLFPFLVTVDTKSTVKYQLPNIQIIGAQKAGTSALAAWLHEEGVCGATTFGDEPAHFNKEVHFFDKETRYQEGTEFYEKRFLDCKGKRFVMDATPATFLYPREFNETYLNAGGDQAAQLKIILILRDPGSRELSLYNHLRSLYLEFKAKDDWYSMIAPNGTTFLDFDTYVDEVFEPNPDNIKWFETSYYANHLEQWIKYFSREQILVLTYDELQTNPELTQNRVRKFLGANETEFSAVIRESNARKSRQKVRVMSCATQTKIHNMFEAENYKLQKFLRENPGPLMEQFPFPSFQEPDCVKISAAGKIHLPNIQMIGAQNAGTEEVSKWLYNEDVCAATVFNESSYFENETHFFDQSDRYAQGIEFYANRFRNCNRQKFSMDATPNYLFHPKKVYATYNEAGENQVDQLNIILILRDPAARELSLYNDMVERYTTEGDEYRLVSQVAGKDGLVMGFDEYAERVLGDNVTFYADHLNEWSKYFSRDQILVLSYDEVIRNPKRIQHRIRKFLSVGDVWFPGEIQVSNSPPMGHRMSCATRTKFDNVFEAENDKIYHFLYNSSTRPSMEENPFLRIRKPSCKPTKKNTT